MDINIMMDKEIQNLISKANNYTKRKNDKLFFRTFGPDIVRKAFTRNKWNKKGVQVPPFLIASIAASCNLNCSGCYARAGGNCGDNNLNEMTAEQWDVVFNDADELGVSFILLAGGEPSMRSDVIREAAKHKKIVFPVFTNGTFTDEDIINLYKENQNLVPIISVEGDDDVTDARRGKGVSSKVKEFIAALKKEDIMFGVSITVTTENYKDVSRSDFVESLHNDGCGAIIYVEYVPSDENSHHLVLSENQLKELDNDTRKMKDKYDDMIIISFPGDEDMMGGCLAAGRGFFHINPSGGAEPCPFSPYSKMDLKKSSIVDVLKSDYFDELRKLTGEKHTHYGGCTLFNERENVQMLLAR